MGLFTSEKNKKRTAFGLGAKVANDAIDDVADSIARNAQSMKKAAEATDKLPALRQMNQGKAILIAGSVLTGICIILLALGLLIKSFPKTVAIAGIIGAILFMVLVITGAAIFARGKKRMKEENGNAAAHAPKKAEGK